MKRIILFRFHENPIICKNRLKLILKFNPEIQIFGLYGGPKNNFAKIKKKLRYYMEDIYCITGSSRWIWKNGDLALRSWYTDYGKYIPFDMAHIIEWDLVLFDSLDNLFSHIPKDALGLTSLVKLKAIEDRWPWSSNKNKRKELNSLICFVRENFAYSKEMFASEGPGMCLPKQFLEKYSMTNIPELSNEEVRVPLFAQIFNLKLINTNFSKGWFNKDNERFFNCNRKFIKLEFIKKEISNPSGRRAFHPYKGIIVLSPMDYLIKIIIDTKYNLKEWKLCLYKCLRLIKKFCKMKLYKQRQESIK